jgi:hypothetical protein
LFVVELLAHFGSTSYFSTGNVSAVTDCKMTMMMMMNWEVVGQLVEEKRAVWVAKMRRMKDSQFTPGPAHALDHAHHLAHGLTHLAPPALLLFLQSHQEINHRIPPLTHHVEDFLQQITQVPLIHRGCHPSLLGLIHITIIMGVEGSIPTINIIPSLLEDMDMGTTLVFLTGLS